MSKFFLKNTTAAEPKPNATVQTSDTPDFGSYLTGFDADLNTPTGAVATRTQTFGAGVDDSVHYSEEIGWISFALASGSTGTGSFSTDVYASVNAVPVSGQVKLKAALFKWLSTDSVSGQIGTTQTTADLTTTITKYTLTFSASTSASYGDGDRFYIAYWFEIRDAVSLGDNGVYFLNISYKKPSPTPRDSSFTVPGTQTLYTAASTVPLKSLMGVGL